MLHCMVFCFGIGFARYILLNMRRKEFGMVMGRIRGVLLWMLGEINVSLG